MALIIQKFGGTSVGTIQRIEHVAEIVAKTRLAGHQVIVVVSAMTGETDRLINLAKTLTDAPSPREYDVLVSTGEQVAIALLSIALIRNGLFAKSFTGDQIPIITEKQHQQARIKNIETKTLTAALKSDIIPVVAGFQGVDENGNTTTLGRGGSDTTAVAIAAAMRADECQIYTDVKGVFTADPRVVPEARLLEKITFAEMLELSSMGAKVLQNRAVEFAGRYRVPLRVLSSFQEGRGTYITFEEHAMEHPTVSGITYSRMEASITLLGVTLTPANMHKILDPLAKANISIDMINQSHSNDDLTNFTFTIARHDYEKTLGLLDKVCEELKVKKVIGDRKIAKLSLVGVGIRSHCGIANKMVKALADADIQIRFISTSEIKISVVVDEKHVEKGVTALHTAFELAKAPAEEGKIPS